jgi:predicted PurR-regulated permease PerM
MGTAGGLQTFGLLGIFIGPMMVAVGKAMLDEWLTYLKPSETYKG